MSLRGAEWRRSTIREDSNHRGWPREPDTAALVGLLNKDIHRARPTKAAWKCVEGKG
jgi:hypothetical protein